MSQHSTGFSECERGTSVPLQSKRIRGPPAEQPTLRLLSFRDLKERKGIKFSRPWIKKLVSDGKFPKPFRPTGGTHIAWLESEIDEWIEACAAARDGVA